MERGGCAAPLRCEGTAGLPCAKGCVPGSLPRLSPVSAVPNPTQSLTEFPSTPQGRLGKGLLLIQG